MSDSSNSQKIAVSYAWKAEDGGSHAGMVEDLCVRLRAAGVKVLRDVSGLKPGDSLLEFMRSIGTSEFVCVFLSDAYLRSPNCMYELLVAWQTCKDDPEKFREKVRVWVAPDAKGIFTAKGRETYSAYWKEIRDEEEALVKKTSTDGLSPDGLAKFRRVKEYCEQLDGILNTLADTLLVANVEDLHGWLETEVPAINGPSEIQIAAVYQRTVQAMDEALGQSLAVADFLSHNTSGLVVQDGGRHRVSDKAGKPPIDVQRALQALEKQLPSALHGFQSSDLDYLETLCGGIMVLGVNPRWIWEQRNLEEAALRYPGYQGTINVPGTSADFLHIVTSAMADGCARLRRVFMEKPLTPQEKRDLPPPALVLAATDAEDQEIELMAHFVDNLSEVKVDRSKPQDVRLAFNQIRDDMSFESLARHNPYYGCGDGFFEHAERIRKFLKPQDFLIISPSGDKSENDLLPQSVWALRHLQDIYNHIKNRRRQLLS
jgi:hypothetical protein